MKSTYNQKLSDIVFSQEELDRYEALPCDVRDTASPEMLELLARSKSLSTVKTTHDMDWPSAIGFVVLLAVVIFIGVLLR